MTCLCRPSQALIDDLSKVEGDIMVLGVAGKMGPTLAGLAKAALPDRRVIGVARFSEPGVKDWLLARGIETINCDLLDEAAIRTLPKAPNIVFMAGTKIRRRGRSVADLGDEFACPCPRRPGFCELAHRRLLDRLRLSLRAC